MKYKFEVVTNKTLMERDWNMDPRDEYDYVLGVYDEKGSDNLGAHVPAIWAIIAPMGLGAEDVENTWYGNFTDELPDRESIVAYLRSRGWEDDGPIVI